VTDRISLALVLHNHQPVGNFGWVIAESYERAYLPMVAALEGHPKIRIGLHYTGPLLEWIRAERPAFLGRLAALVARDQVELLGGGYYEPVLASLPERDRIDQLVRMAVEIERYIVELVSATRPDGEANGAAQRFVRYGVSPRGAQAIVMGAKVHALVRGRVNVSFEDIDRVVTAALNHPAQSCANLPILARGSDAACMLPDRDGTALVLVPHDAITALQQHKPVPRIAQWSGEPGALDLWMALMTGATVTLSGQALETAA